MFSKIAILPLFLIVQFSLMAQEVHVTDTVHHIINEVPVTDTVHHEIHNEIKNDTLLQLVAPEEKFQPPSIYQKDSSVYMLFDSIEKAQIIQDRLKFFEAILSGNAPFGYLNIDYRKFFAYSEFEGIKLGLGVSTNRNVSNHFTIGGYLRYAFNDKKWTSGTYLQLFPSWSSDTKLNFQFRNDFDDIGGYHFLDEYMLNSTEMFRNIDVDQMMAIKTGEADFSFRFLRAFKINLFLIHTQIIIPNYIFTPLSNDFDGVNSTFYYTETGINLKFAMKELFIEAPSGKLISAGTYAPMIWFNVRRGIPLFGGEYTYTKYEFKLLKIFVTRLFGQSQMVMVAGKTTGDIPITNLYNGHASYATITIDAENTFATMRMDEFYVSDFASLFFKQNFGGTWFHEPYFRPYFSLVTNVGVGKLSNADHQGPNMLTSFNKGYYESGALINNLLISGNLINLGFGTFYRYGPYAFENVSHNFAYRITINFILKK